MTLDLERNARSTGTAAGRGVRRCVAECKPNVCSKGGCAFGHLATHTVRVGHPDVIDDDRLAEVRAALGIKGPEHDEELRVLLRVLMAGIESIAGVRFGGGLRTRTLDVRTGGLPFVYIRDISLHEEHQDEPGTWPIPDPVQPMFARVLQIGRLPRRTEKPASMAAALRLAAGAVHLGLARGLFVEGVWRWIAQASREVGMEQVLRDAADPSISVMAPALVGEAPGWWLQVTRRLILVHGGTPAEEPDRVELLYAGKGWALVACEPVVILARTTEHPVDLHHAGEGLAFRPGAPVTPLAHPARPDGDPPVRCARDHV